jgi:hypothetical protein
MDSPGRKSHSASQDRPRPQASQCYEYGNFSFGSSWFGENGFVFLRKNRNNIGRLSSLPHAGYSTAERIAAQRRIVIHIHQQKTSFLLMNI